MYILPEDGEVPPKYVGINKEPYCYICQMCVCWFYKRAVGRKALYKSCQNENEITAYILIWLVGLEYERWLELDQGHFKIASSDVSIVRPCASTTVISHVFK